jgi:hypothetical protein
MNDYLENDKAKQVHNVDNINENDEKDRINDELNCPLPMMDDDNLNSDKLKCPLPMSNDLFLSNSIESNDDDLNSDMFLINTDYSFLNMDDEINGEDDDDIDGEDSVANK